MDVNHKPDIPKRTPEMIAAEITVIKAQTKKILLVSAVEIGLRLLEAQKNIPQGKFLSWLEDAVQYSERTAYNLMRLAEEYGPVLSGTTLSIAGSGAKTESLAKLGYSQALVLLGLPAEERAEFITQLDLENTAVRELQQAVNDRKLALAEKAALQKERDAQKSINSKLSAELGEVKDEAKEKKESLWAEQEKVTKLQRELNALKDESATARHIAMIERESKIAKINASMAQADARFDLLVKGFDDLFSTIKDMSAADPKAFLLYLKQTNNFIAKTTERLRRLEKTVPPIPEP